jgi:hypothetical protein
MTSIKAVEMWLPLGGMVWYKNVQQNDPYVTDYGLNVRRTDAQGYPGTPE